MYPSVFIVILVHLFLFFAFIVTIHLTTVEWFGFKLTFLEKDICHDHEIDILRSLANLQLRYV